MINSEFCNREVVVGDAKSTIGELAGLMKKFHAGDVIIVEKVNDGNIPIGIVTDRDIVIKVIAESIPVDSIRAEDILTTDISVVQEESSLWETLELMRSKGIRRVPVVNARRELVGIITVDDILEIVSEEVIMMVKTIRKEQTQEVKRIGSI